MSTMAQTPGKAAERLRHRSPLFIGMVYALLVFFALLMLFPFYWLIRSSLMTSTEIFSMPVQWWPSRMLWSNYRDALTSAPFGLYFKNTLFLLVINEIGQLLSSSFIAFGFVRIRFKTRNFWFALVLATMMLPSSVMLIPQFIGWKLVGAYNTYFPLTIPAFFGNAFYIFLLRQFYSSIPLQYDEAAYMDGANYLQIYRRIILPLSKPALMTIGVFTFLGVWNDFFGPLIYVSDSDKWNLSLGLMGFTGQYSSQWEYQMAASATIFAPMILVYFFAQKTIMQGANLSGGIKG